MASADTHGGRYQFWSDRRSIALIGLLGHARERLRVAVMLLLMWLALIAMGLISSTVEAVRRRWRR